MSDVQTSGAVDEVTAALQAVDFILSPNRPLWGERDQAATRSLFSKITKALDADARSNVGIGMMTGEQPHPVDFDALDDLDDYSPHHATCIRVKKNHTVGLGFVKQEEETDPMTGQVMKEEEEESKVDKVLDPLCELAFMDVLFDAVEDYFRVGNGFIEVVRSPDTGEITGLHHLPARMTYVYLQEDRDWHYEIMGADGQVRFAKFGNTENLMQQQGDSGEVRSSEVIHLRMPSSKTTYYGYPDYLSAVASIDLDKMMVQHFYDFFKNRGVPEFLLFFLGEKIRKPDWAHIVTTLKQQVGEGNSHKSAAFNIDLPELKVQLEKLGIESNSGEVPYQMFSDTNATRIVTAHQVPPPLAGILIPGKVGAINELPNAILSFYWGYVLQHQMIIWKTLARTLGSAESGLGLSPGDFRFRNTVDALDLKKADTMARMRQTPQEAAAENRNLGAGVKD